MIKTGNHILINKLIVACTLSFYVMISQAEAFNEVKFHKLAKSTAANGEFRHCSIDLFDGDFIYLK